MHLNIHRGGVSRILSSMPELISKVSQAGSLLHLETSLGSTIAALYVPQWPSSTCHHCCPYVHRAWHSPACMMAIRVPWPTGHSGLPRTPCPCPHAALACLLAPDAY